MRVRRFGFAAVTSLTLLEFAQAINIIVFIILIMQTFFCSSPQASSPSDTAGCRDDAKLSPQQQQRH